MGARDGCWEGRCDGAVDELGTAELVGAMVGCDEVVGMNDIEGSCEGSLLGAFDG